MALQECPSRQQVRSRSITMSPRARQPDRLLDRGWDTLMAINSPARSRRADRRRPGRIELGWELRHDYPGCSTVGRA